MLLFFLGSILFLSNSLSLNKLHHHVTADDVMMHIQMAMKNQTSNSKSLIESLEKLDPQTIASVVVLIKELQASAAADLLALEQASASANTAYDGASTAYNAAVAEKVRLDEAISAYQASLAQQIIVVTSTLDTKNTASGAKTNAQDTLDAESPRLKQEGTTLTQVLALINGLEVTSVPQDGLYSWFKPSKANAAWSSVIGNWEGVASGTVVPIVVTEAGNGASVPITFLTGTKNTLYNFGAIVPATFTICSMSRYLHTANSGGRILQASGNNWLHGHWSGMAGMNYYQGWNTGHAVANGVSPKLDWLIMCGSSDISQAIYVNGVAISDAVAVRKGNVSPKNGNLWINPTEKSDWAVAEVITWDRVLTVTEIEEVSANMRKELSG